MKKNIFKLYKGLKQFIPMAILFSPTMIHAASYGSDQLTKSFQYRYLISANNIR